MITIADDEQASARLLLLRMIVARGGAIELRALASGRVPLREHHDHPATASQRAGELADGRDVYCGALARHGRGGGRDALREGWALWADCDTPESVARLRDYRPSPTFVVASGSGGRHGWWFVNPPPLSLAGVERANRRLAHHLGADTRSCDAARILRLPGTSNHKTDPPRPVVCLAVGETADAAALVRELPDPQPPRAEPPPIQLYPRSELNAIPPPVYVAALTGRTIGRDGKTLCPLHDERTPSFHAYAAPEAGWYCFGCGRGGDIFTLAAELWGLDSRADFPELRERLAERLLGVVT